jgi:hypothetical protein|tara:strand:+ start:146 stop:595 length:450 start_codon:yes stop_codon:yes gene_type:complete
VGLKQANDILDKMPYKDPEIRKIKAKEYNKRWYEKNKTAHRLNASKNRRKYKKQWDQFKASHKCSHCGANHPAVIDFHHVERNKNNPKVNELVKNKRYRAAMEEVNKCVPLCANCHRILHWNEEVIKKQKRTRKRKLKKSKLLSKSFKS